MAGAVRAEKEEKIEEDQARARANVRAEWEKQVQRLAPGLWIIRVNDGDPTTTRAAVNDENRLPPRGIAHRKNV